MNESLRERIRLRLEALPDEKAYQVLDFIEFLESKYAERPARPGAFQKVAHTLEDTLRAGRVPMSVIRGTMDAVSTAGRFLEGLAAAGRAAIEKPPPPAPPPPPPSAGKPVEEVPPGT